MGTMAIHFRSTLQLLQKNPGVCQPEPGRPGAVLLALELDLAGAAGRAAGQSARGPFPSSDRALVLGAGGRAGRGSAARPRPPAAGTGQGC